MTPPVSSPELTRFGFVLRDVFQVVRWLVVAYVVAAMLALVWTTPRQTSFEDYEADLRAGRVEWVATGEVQASDHLSVWRRDPDGNQVTWSVGIGYRDVRYMNDAEASRLVNAARADGIDVVPQRSLARSLAGSLPLIAMASVLVLLAGPQPRRATKWAWFWLFGLPGCVGLLAWMVLDAPWSRAAMARPDPGRGGRYLRPEDRRLRGGRAFVFALFGGLLISALYQGAFGYLG